MNFKVLIVEDETEKLRRIMVVLEQVLGTQVETVESVSDAATAKVRLRQHTYDLLILDISIPLRRTTAINPHGGLELLEEILQRPEYHQPTHIIGLTAHDDLLEVARARLAANALSIIHYQINSTAWEHQLQAGVEQRMAAKRSAANVAVEYDYDVAFLCALRSEWAAVRSLPGWEWSELSIAHDDSAFYQAHFSKPDGQVGKAVATVSARMGMPAAAAAAMKLMMRFRPRYLFMTGIMGGVEGKTNLGDLVVASPIWDWGNGKWSTTAEDPTQGEQASSFAVDPYQFTLEPALERMANRLAENETELFTIRRSFGAGGPDRDLKLYVGPVASGAAVLDDSALLAHVRRQHRKLLGVEMEAYGMFTAAAEAPHPKPSCMSIKAVVDFANGRKGDEYQAYGAHVSARVAQFFIENYCFR